MNIHTISDRSISDQITFSSTASDAENGLAYSETSLLEEPLDDTLQRLHEEHRSMRQEIQDAQLISAEDLSVVINASEFYDENED